MLIESVQSKQVHKTWGNGDCTMQGDEDGKRQNHYVQSLVKKRRTCYFTGRHAAPRFISTNETFMNNENHE